MRFGHKLISLLISIVLAVGLCPLPALAAESDGDKAPGLVAGSILEASTLSAQASEEAYADCKVVQASCGSVTTAAVMADGTLWMWGGNGYGQLGDGTMKKREKPVKVMDGVVQVSCGDTHTAAVRDDGTLWAWGNNTFGQIGDGTKTARLSPVKVLDGVAQVSFGPYHTAAVRDDGTLWMWGNNEEGELGDGTTVDQKKPVKVMDGVVQVSCGVFHTAAVRADGTLWAWGWNISGEVGDGTANMRKMPVKVMDGVVQVSCGDSHTAAVMSDGTLWAWGDNESGQVGDGTAKDRKKSVKVMDGVVQVSCGAGHTAAVRSDGTLWAWGVNKHGQVGDGTTAASFSPVKVMDGVVQVSCGDSHTAAVMSDGTLGAWGRNSKWQLGGNSNSDRIRPAQIVLDENAPGATTVVPSWLSMGAGETSRIAASGFGDVTYGSSDPSVASVAADGAVTAVSPGTAIISVGFSGDDSHEPTEKSVRVTVSEGDQGVSARIGKSTIFLGETTRITASGIGALSYFSSNPQVATVSSRGTVKAKALGTAIITVRAAGDAAHEAGRATVKVTVAKRPITGATFKGVMNRAYTGKAVTQPSLKVKFGGRTLREGVDYEVSYENNGNVGTASVTIKGIGNYTGEKAIKYKILRRSISDMKVCLVDGNLDLDYEAISKGEVGGALLKKIKRLGKTEYVYSSAGKGIRPTVVVFGPDGVVPADNLKCTFKHNAGIGFATVKIRGMKNHKGGLSARFKIIPARAKISSIRKPEPYALEVSANPVDGATVYQFSIDNGHSVKKTSTSNAATFTKLDADDTYEVSVRAGRKVGSNTIWGEWSPVKTATPYESGMVGKWKLTGGTNIDPDRLYYLERYKGQYCYMSLNKSGRGSLYDFYGKFDSYVYWSSWGNHTSGTVDIDGFKYSFTRSGDRLTLNGSGGVYYFKKF